MCAFLAGVTPERAADPTSAYCPLGSGYAQSLQVGVAWDLGLVAVAASQARARPRRASSAKRCQRVNSDGEKRSKVERNRLKAPTPETARWSRSASLGSPIVSMKAACPGRR